MKLLTVDDSMVMRKIIKTVASALSFEVYEAPTAFDGLEVLNKYGKEIDVILLDWNMPGMDGYEFLSILKSSEDFKSIPVMMVTTENQKENIENAINAGAKNYLTKPFTVEELEKKILACIDKEGG